MMNNLVKLYGRRVGTDIQEFQIPIDQVRILYEALEHVLSDMKASGPAFKRFIPEIEATWNPFMNAYRLDQLLTESVVQVFDDRIHIVQNALREWQRKCPEKDKDDLNSVMLLFGETPEGFNENYKHKN